MKAVIFLALVAIASAKSINEELVGVPSAYGFIENVSIPLAEKIRKAEAEAIQSRIVGGSESQLGQFPYQAGLLTRYLSISGTGICGGSLVTANRVITAAHCWFDGRHQGDSVTVVLGSTTIFTGGTRVTTPNVVMHPQWTPTQVRNDVAVIYLPIAVSYSPAIGPIALPTGAELQESFAGESAVASGFGRLSSSIDITTSQVLSHVQLNIISNTVCRLAFPLWLRDSNICTSGLGGPGTCQGDSGGPLTVQRNGRSVLIGITSFGSGLGCDSHMPAVYARVSSFVDFFNQHM